MEELANERNHSTINVEQLTNLLYGGEHQVKRKREIELSISNDPIYDVSKYHFLERGEKYDQAVKKAVYTIKTKIPALGITDLSEKKILFDETIGFLKGPFDTYDDIFLGTVLGQGTKDQIAKWAPLARSGEILTCYAQTELGHGTFVQGLETTAKYDPLREEFVLNTPTLTSYKWWAGCLGIVATHTVLAARLITEGEDRGIHYFITQLRRMDNHRPLAGVTVGDIGPKFGLEQKDNGFLKLDHLRIPRENMLMKFSRVDPDGTYTRRLSSKLAYGSMVLLRTGLVYYCYRSLSKGVTIAIRYSAVRRQTRNKAGEAETQLLDYTNQQYTLLPLLATTYALYFLSHHVTALFGRTQSQLERENLELLPELHAASSGLKATASKLCSQGIETCRIACGGHGYSQASGFPYLYSSTVAVMTVEGDYHILLLQTARYLVKMWKRVRDNPSYLPPDNVSYLASAPDASVPVSLLSSQRQLRLYGEMARACVARAAVRLEEGNKRGLDPFQAWNAAGIELIQCAEAHTYYLIVKSFIQSLELPQVRSMDSANQRILKSLSDIFALHYLVDRAGAFLEGGAVESSELREARAVLVGLLKEVRREAVCLVDAFDIPDFVLRSALGRKDGDVYRALWEWVEQNPSNKNQDGVHPVYGKYLKQLLNSKL